MFIGSECGRGIRNGTPLLMESEGHADRREQRRYLLDQLSFMVFVIDGNLTVCVALAPKCAGICFNNGRDLSDSSLWSTVQNRHGILR
ncbi:hypothetical protein HUJ05_002403 [Dendroctonus ponderosae]|nr:hypothetical protein HUJ05_002403 [Dendroctonus ponderosae]